MGIYRNYSKSIYRNYIGTIWVFRSYIQEGKRERNPQRSSEPLMYAVPAGGWFHQCWLHVVGPSGWSIWLGPSGLVHLGWSVRDYPPLGGGLYRNYI